MFGLSVSELLVIAAVIAVVWYAVRRGDRVRRTMERADRADRAAPPAVEDMTKCPVCGLYVLARAAHPCDRTDCPYRN